MTPRTITITPDSGVFRATLADNATVTATGVTEADALTALAARIQEYGWVWSPAKPETPAEPEPPQ